MKYWIVYFGLLLTAGFGVIILLVGCSQQPGIDISETLRKSEVPLDN